MKILSVLHTYEYNEYKNLHLYTGERLRKKADKVGTGLLAPPAIIRHPHQFASKKKKVEKFSHVRLRVSHK